MFYSGTKSQLFKVISILIFAFIFPHSLQAEELVPDDWQWGPAFPCSKAGNKIEKQICASLLLRAHDKYLSLLYRKAREIGDRDSIKKSQRRWLKTRNRCTDKTCIATQYEERITALQALIKANAGDNVELSPAFYLNGQEPDDILQIPPEESRYEWLEKRVKGAGSFGDYLDGAHRDHWQLVSYFVEPTLGRSHFFYRSAWKKPEDVQLDSADPLADFYNLSLSIDYKDQQKYVYFWGATANTRPVTLFSENIKLRGEENICKDFDPSQLRIPGTQKGLWGWNRDEQYSMLRSANFSRKYYISDLVDIDNDQMYESIALLEHDPLRCVNSALLELKPSDLEIRDTALNKFIQGGTSCYQSYQPILYDDKTYLAELGVIHPDKDEKVLSGLYLYDGEQVKQICSEMLEPTPSPAPYSIETDGYKLLPLGERRYTEDAWADASLKDLHIHKFSQDEDSPNDPFCVSMLTALKDKRARPLMPLIETDKINDEGLKPWLQNCKLEDFTVTYTWEGNTWDNVQHLPEEEQIKYADRSEAKGPFKLYRADVYHQGGDALAVYAGCNLPLGYEQCSSGIFTNLIVMDTQACKAKHTLQVDEQYYKDPDSKESKQVGVLNFENKDYFYQSSLSEPNGLLYIRVYDWNEKHRYFPGLAKCYFSNSPQE